MVDKVTPMAIDVTLAVQKELETRFEEADAIRRKHVERAAYEVDLARRRYMRVDPENRLVADSLEAEWNIKLRALSEAEEECTRQRDADRHTLHGDQRARLMKLASDLPTLWKDPATPNRERKRILRLLVEDVTLVRTEQIAVHVRFRGGATESLSVPLPLPAWRLRQIDPSVIAEIDRLIDNHTDAEIAAILEQRGVRTYEGTIPHPRMIARLRRDYRLASRFERLRARGLLTRDEIAKRLGVNVATVKYWRNRGWLRGVPYNDKSDYVYEPPGPDAPKKFKWKARNFGRPTTQ
ncbi:MAG TPA: hypothetical protein VJN18_18905 [Polyangiaceae bacterium]|nr:hypothetical protein [Polyangiaceae bacterium]